VRGDLAPPGGRDQALQRPEVDGTRHHAAADDETRRSGDPERLRQLLVARLRAIACWIAGSRMSALSCSVSRPTSRATFMTVSSVTCSVAA
jgi:hypothetical protein